jgi:hypothetical protein
MGHWETNQLTLSYRTNLPWQGLVVMVGSEPMRVSYYHPLADLIVPEVLRKLLYPWAVDQLVEARKVTILSAN